MWCGFLNIKPHTTQCGVVLSLPLAVWLLYFTGGFSRIRCNYVV